VTFQVPTVASTRMTIFWDVSPRSVVESDRRFRGAAVPIIRTMMEALSTPETSVILYLRGYLTEQDPQLAGALP
jgi:hypothetical protein